MIKIGFIISNDAYNYKPFRNQPLVALYLLTIIEKHFRERVQVSMIDIRKVEQESVLYHISENDLFLYSVATPEFNEVVNVVEKLRSVYPNAKHIGGGAHINIFPKESSVFFDAIILGEGEEPIIEAIEDILNNLALKPFYRMNKPVDLNSYGFPYRKYLPKSAMVDIGLLDGKHSNLRATTVIFSRGCPFDCYFCANKDLTFGSVRYRSPRMVREEIEYLKREFQIEALALKDDTSIPLNVKIARPFLETIRSANIKWRGQSRANGVHPDMVRLARESGCTDIAIGIESVSADVLKLVNKRIDLEKAKEYITLFNKVGIGVKLHFIIGLPGEPDDIVERTLDFIDETNPKSVLLSLFCPMPGSHIYKFPKQFGIKLETTDWQKYHTAFGRFDADEMPTMTFEYEKYTPWGRGMSKGKIIENYMKAQRILRERGLNF